MADVIDIIVQETTESVTINTATNVIQVNVTRSSGGGGGVTKHSELILDDGTNPHGTTAANVGAYTQSQVDSLLDDKVDKVTGYGLSKNDLTDLLLAKLQSLNIKNIAKYVNPLYDSNWVSMTSETIVGYAQIDNSSIDVGSILQLYTKIYKNGTSLGTAILRVYYSTSNSSFDSLNKLGTFNITATSRVVPFQRRFHIKSDVSGGGIRLCGDVASTISALNTDLQVYANTKFNRPFLISDLGYIIVTLESTNVGDEYSVEEINLTLTP